MQELLFSPAPPVTWSTVIHKMSQARLTEATSNLHQVHLMNNPKKSKKELHSWCMAEWRVHNTYRGYCNYWRQKDLTHEQLQNIEAIEKTLATLEKVLDSFSYYLTSCLPIKEHYFHATDCQ